MGVTGLWTILHPCARPIKLETLNRKRLAVDASIWIYQFLKAVRDKEGNALRNSHVVGFFRRICKLLFFGIRPVFVFDGGAPVLKRHTVSERKKRREGRREDAVRTAGRLLGLQMQRRAEEEEARRRERPRRTEEEDEAAAVPDEGLVYVDEINMTQQERQQSRKFRKKDAYHLPDLDVSMSEMGGPNDPRVMSLEELQSYARQFETGEDINVYDFSKIDFDSPFFVSLPASDRYNILNAARLRSRLRMGHSKEQLDTMFPDRMAFSRFQIERVTERNELTQRLMHLNEGGDTLFNGGRVAGEKGREYVLVKNDGVEGGWALGVISDEGTKQENAIDVDKPVVVPKQEDEWEDEEDFEDVPIEGLNRLPKLSRATAKDDHYSRQRKTLYKSRKAGPPRRPKKVANPDSLFVTDEPQGDISEGLEEEYDGEDADPALFGEAPDANQAEDEELRRAIALSLEGRERSPVGDNASETRDSPSEDDMLEVFEQSAVPEAKALPKGSGRAIASIVNKRAFDSAPESREVTSFGVPAPKSDAGSSEDDSDTMDLQAALAESRKTKHKAGARAQRPMPPPPHPKAANLAVDLAKKAGFSGPLPFEKLNLGSSLLGKKKMQERTEENAGGFENPALAEGKKQQKTEPVPPWFSGDLDEDIRRQKALESDDRQQVREFNQRFQFQERGERLRREDTDQVIDLEAEDQDMNDHNADVIDLGAAEKRREQDYTEGTIVFDPKLRMGDVADKALIEPPGSDVPDHRQPSPQQQKRPPIFEDVSSDGEQEQQIPSPMPPPPAAMASDEEPYEWSASEDETTQGGGKMADSREVGTENSARESRSPSAEFEDVHIPAQPNETPAQNGGSSTPVPREEPGFVPASGTATQQIDFDAAEQAEFDNFSDPEDEELLLALAQETEEHARFASTLNHRTQTENAADYEKELKQLRNQQKKDRRDADEITQVMIQECQQLLRHFGLPYVTAPMEAEAQCAELVRLGLVDGIVTDDSDCFLFGGTRIYKNMFNQAKFVECYLATDLQKEFDLTREKLIQVAHLLGSDYTEGLPGVGPVTALEILAEFPALNDFKAWWTAVQMNTIPKSDDAAKPFRKKFRRNATKLFLPPTFPDARVDTAYLEPQVDSDPEPFQWGVPDLISLRAFLMATIGWSEERTDEVLVPVIRDMNRRADEGTQSNITAFFDGGVGIGSAGAGGSKATAAGEAFAPRKRVQESSKRLGSALTRMAEQAKGPRVEAPQVAPDTTGGTGVAERSSGARGKRTTNTTKRSAPASDDASDDDGSAFEEPARKSKGRNGRKKTRVAV